MRRDKMALFGNLFNTTRPDPKLRHSFKPGDPVTIIRIPDSLGKDVLGRHAKVNALEGKEDIYIDIAGQYGYSLCNHRDLDLGHTYFPNGALVILRRTHGSNSRYIHDKCQILARKDPYYTVIFEDGKILRDIRHEQLEHTLNPPLTDLNNLPSGSLVIINKGSMLGAVGRIVARMVSASSNGKTLYMITFPQHNDCTFSSDMILEYTLTAYNPDGKEKEISVPDPIEAKPKLDWDTMTEVERSGFVRKIVESMYVDKELVNRINSLIE